jgi:IS1 family transposase
MIGKTPGHYEITSQLGKGGMGEVYHATDTKLGRDAAIKVLPEEFAKDADRVARFQREAKLLASLKVWSRLWPSTTDGFPVYEEVIRRIFGPACLHGQVIKTRGNDRVIKVERRGLIGAAWRFELTWRDSEDSSKLNTSFIERLNLTIRQGSAYLCRRTICHARWKECLEDHLELFRCCCNSIRPHRALKFGPEIRPPATRAGLASKRLSSSEVFVAAPSRIIFVIMFIAALEIINGISE